MTELKQLLQKFKYKWTTLTQNYPFLKTLPKKVQPMATRTNIILLLLVLWSAYHVVDLNNNIRHQTQLYGKAQEREIRLNQDYAEIQYQLSQAVDAKVVNNAATKMNMHEPSPEETVILQFR